METINTTSPLHSFDAKVWADDFCAIAKTFGHDLDKDWMLGWFANALMRGWDEHRNRNQEKLNAFEPGGAVERARDILLAFQQSLEKQDGVYMAKVSPEIYDILAGRIADLEAFLTKKEAE